MQRLVDVIDGKALESHWRRNRVDGEVRRVCLHKSFGRGKPQTPVARAPRRGVAVGCRFAAAQAIGGAELNPMRAVSRHGAIAARNAIAGGKPEMIARRRQEWRGCWFH